MNDFTPPKSVLLIGMVLRRTSTDGPLVGAIAQRDSSYRRKYGPGHDAGSKVWAKVRR